MGFPKVIFINRFEAKSHNSNLIFLMISVFNCLLILFIAAYDMIYCFTVFFRKLTNNSVSKSSNL